MLIDEAAWLGRELHILDPERVYPLLDVGSSTRRFRTQEQPWIDALVFAPARAAGRPVLHLDAKPAEGVDIVADLGDPQTIATLKARGIRAVFCSNLLEHVENPAAVARSLLAIVPRDGYLFLSCPYRYPFHPDPIDTGFRPTPEELVKLFPGTRMWRHAIVRDGTYFDGLRRTPMASLRLMVRLLLPFYRRQAWRAAISEVRHHLPWLFRRFEASCLVLIHLPGGDQSADPP